MNICEYGCGREAIYKLKNGKFCCSYSYNKCGIAKIKNSLGNKGKKRNEEFCKKMRNINSSEKNGMFGKKHSESSRRKISESSLGRASWNKFTIEKINEKYNFFSKIEELRYYINKQNEKEIQVRCKNHNCVNSKEKGGWFTPTYIQLYERIRCIEKHGVDHSHFYCSKICKKTCILYFTLSKNKKYLTIEKINKKYLFFSKIEEIRYNPDKLQEKEIQVRCKNHNCVNSKEKGGWFTPTKTQMSERIRCLERGDDLSYFYCSQECKNSCPLFMSRGADPFKNKDLHYTDSEYQTFRQHVLNRDNHICQFCCEEATEVHHERPQKLEPFFALDPDFAWSCCEKCHLEKGHKINSECSTGNLANKICS